jgi:hypothetical protein
MGFVAGGEEWEWEWEREWEREGSRCWGMEAGMGVGA